MNEQEQNNARPTPTNKLKKLFIGVLLLTLLFSVTLNIVLLTQKNNQDTPTARNINICGTDDITKSNEKLSALTEEKTASEYKVLANDISNRENWEEDINCHYISFYSAVLDNDAGTAEKQFMAIKELSESGHSLDLRFDNILSIKSIAAISDQMRQGVVNSDDTLGGTPESTAGVTSE
ncbi:hypothetical protein ACWOC1_10580 [Enterococcus quebecensis]|uniref:Uncharacterized protein n=1 Tax=Enterococcus quebecensis TaxID=903983 RepID=A0A1E5H2I5_9ENTE|nr:hypothetical protein [Enterococcus quebecensis]OEG18840.1 hypothetical protein BCR23_12930 [Enterococcus quebecensis]OJG71827.1 hypothetical protein RV12_GL001469 [Enterococcus quebecensis]